jgi:hypothetical protein
VVLFPREVLGEQRFDTTLPMAEDQDMWIRLASRAPIYLQSEVTATLVVVEESLSQSDVAVNCSCMLRVVRRHAGMLGPVTRRR